MKRLTKIAQTATPSTGVLFRGAAYGAAGTREFLRRGDAYQRANNAAVKLGDIPPGAFVDVFDVPLRLCVGNGLQGKRFAMQYSLFAQNLRAPATGKLRLLF